MISKLRLFSQKMQLKAKEMAVVQRTTFASKEKKNKQKNQEKNLGN